MISFGFRGTLEFQESVYQVRFEVAPEQKTPEPPEPLPSKADEKNWLLVVPPEEWKEPIPITRAAAEAVLEMALRLGLVHNFDLVARKLYVGGPEAEPVEEGLLYPSGARLPLVDLAEEAHLHHLYTPADKSVAAPLVEPDLKAKVSQHFTAGEFMPKDPKYRYLRLLPELVELLEAIRAEVGVPLMINSAYRPPHYNAQVGGVPHSTHIDGLAADISTETVPVARLHEVADRLVGHRGGVGFYPSQNFVHVDLRGQKTRWSS